MGQMDIKRNSRNLSMPFGKLRDTSIKIGYNRNTLDDFRKTPVKRQCLPVPRVHKETENEDQDQDQTYKLQLLDKKYCKVDEIFTIFSGG